jgi:hypothetical protein
MRHARHMLLDPFKVPGALVPGLRSHFAGVAREAVPERLTELARECERREADGAANQIDQRHRNAPQHWRAARARQGRQGRTAGELTDDSHGDKRIATRDRAYRRG